MRTSRGFRARANPPALTVSDAHRPSISVIIPTFNRAPVVSRAIHSVLAQELRDLEVVVVDDGSTDDTQDVVQQIQDGRLVRIVQETNRGVADARNAGVIASSANMVTFLDSDDEAAPSWLQAFIDRRAAGCDLVFCGAHFVGPGSAYRLLLPEQQGPEMGGIRGLYLAGTYALDKQLFHSIGGFRSGLRFSENTDVGMRIGGHHLQQPLRVGHVDEPLLTIHRDSRPYDATLRYESAMALLHHDDEHLRRSPTVRATYLAMAGMAADRLGRRKEARQLLLSAIAQNPRAPKNYLRFVRTLLPVQRARTQ